MTRRRTRPRRRQTPTSRLAPCVYTPDLTLPDPSDLDHPLCATKGCGLPWRHPRHRLPDAPPEQAEHLRRYGVDQ